MKLKYWSGYLAAYYFLKTYWDKYQTEIDDLAMILSSMNPFMWEGGLPMDHEMVTQWLDVFLEGNVLRENEDEWECFKHLAKYVKLQEKDFGANLKSLINKLEDTIDNKDKNKEIWNMWIDACLTGINAVDREK